MTDPEFETVLRGLPLWLLRQYLLDLGAVPSSPNELVGPGWRAELEQVKDYVIGSVRVGQVRLALTGQPAAVAALRQALAPRLLRAGG
jgi:hypothetical protein